jgi:hypothetical protein
VVLLALASPLALVILGIGALSAGTRVGLTVAVLLLALTVAAPTREGLWIGTWWLYRCSELVLPTAVQSGRGCRARVRDVAGAMQVTRVRGPLVLARGRLRLAPLLSIPAFASLEPGVIRLTPGGCRAILLVDGPDGSLGSEGYAQWCAGLIGWLLSVECPAQMLAVISHFDSHRAQAAFDRRTQGWPRTPLADVERAVAGQVAEQTLGMRHFVVLCPGLAPADGIPYLSRLTRVHRVVEASAEAATRAMQSAIRLAAGTPIDVAIPDRDDIAGLLGGTAAGAGSAAVTRAGLVHVGELHQLVLTATQLPPVVQAGSVVDALIRSRVQGIASLHLMPVDPAVARRALDRRAALQRYSAREGNREIDNQMALADTSAMLAALAQRDVTACRVALTVAVSHPERAGVAQSAERLGANLRGQGFGVTVATSPALLPALAVAPGGTPLGRSLQLTSNDVAACLLPALGTPFADINLPLAGVSELTGAPVYLSVWTRPNHNAVILGSSGSGKSVAAKTLLIRHLMAGGSGVVVDPDSEYRRVMNAVGGIHLELGEDALNPLAAAADAPPDVAAGLVLPVLSVMAGDEKGVRDGRPIRRLPDEDQGWLYTEVAAFLRSWGERPRPEPVLHDLVSFIQTQSAAHVLTPSEAERCRVITARLLRFTQGDRGHVFDRPSTFRVGSRPVAIGLRAFAMTYAADLTPALAVVLTAVLAALGRDGRRLVIVVDEAHRVTVDPDAGAVLGQLVRQARKYGAGVWMCSQRVEDFVGTDLGRTLAATAATKLLLGTEEAALVDLKEVFALGADELSAVNPPSVGRGVLVSGGERTVISILPGPAILALAETTPVWRPRAAPPLHPVA